MKLKLKSFLPKKKVLLWLFLAGWLLLGVCWVMSAYAYSRLPQETALWVSLWRAEAVWAEKSLLFFIFPLAQTFLFLLFSVAARMIFFRESGAGERVLSEDGEKKSRLLDLKKEVVYLTLIFINLIFIHLQTSLVLLSHRIGQGINWFYFFMLIGVILMFIPYYYARRKMLLR